MSYKFKADLGWIQFDIDAPDAESFEQAVSSARGCAISAQSLQSSMRHAVKGMFEDPECWDNLLDYLVELMQDEGFVRHMDEPLPAHLCKPKEEESNQPPAPIGSNASNEGGPQSEAPLEPSPMAPAFKECVENSMAIIEELAQKVAEDVANRERQAIKDKFGAMRRGCGFTVQKIDEAAGKTNGWCQNRQYGKSWPTQEDLDTLALAIQKLRPCEQVKPLDPVMNDRPQVLRRLHLNWDAAFCCAVLMAEGKPDDAIAATINKQFFKWGGSSIDTVDVAQLRSALSSDVKALETAIAISPGEFNQTKPAIQNQIRARGGVDIEFMREKR